MIFNKTVYLIFQRFVVVQHTSNRLFSMSTSLMNLSASMRKLINGKNYQEALDLFHQNSTPRSDFEITLALKACTKLKNLEYGMNIHQHLSSQTITNPFINVSLIHFYMTCGDEDNAYRVFDAIKNKTSAAYGAMFKGFLTNKKPEKVFELFDQMLIEADEINLTILFKACVQLPNEHALKIKNKFLDQMPNLSISDTWTLNSFLNMLMKFGDVSNAENVFVQIKKKDIFTYGVIIQGFLENKMYEKALDAFEQMSFSPDEVIVITLFKICTQLANERALKLGRRVFNQMPKKFYKDVILVTSTLQMLMKFGDITIAEKVFSQTEFKNLPIYVAMMNGYNINNKPEQYLKLFDQMQQRNIVADEIIFTIVLGACSQIGLHSRGERIVTKIPSYLLNDYRLQNTLIDMWGKVGSVSEALKVFEHVHKPNVITYTAMINVFGLNGMGNEAIDLYRQMPVDMQNEVTHICVLNACSHSGLVDQAHSIFNGIKVKTGKIITTMVDCMSRMFMFDEAQKLINDFEKSHSPVLVMYMALLSGARNHRNWILSEKIYDRMKHLFPTNKQHLISGAVLLSNTYLSAGENQQAEEVRLNRMQQFGKEIMIGMTWTEANGELVRFKAHDHTHPQSKQIYDELERISAELIENGHQYDSSWITRAIHDDESIESILCGHSEKLAIAFNFIQQPIPKVIQVSKNLRICGDCHAATKLIAKLRQRPIILRDANRIHHFSINGQCSCQNHF